MFVSFTGENLLAVIKDTSLEWGFWETHAGVMTIVLPFCIGLSFIPSLKGLAPVTTIGSALVVFTLILMATVGVETWSNRPSTYDLPRFDASSMPMALCAVLYSYEGINLIIPIEAAMKEPKHYGPTFASAMLVVAIVMACFGCGCVYAFGNVTNGSVTAFLIQRFSNNKSMRHLVHLANAAISLSVLMTYPLQLLPTIELLGPGLSKLLGIDNSSSSSTSGSPLKKAIQNAGETMGVSKGTMTSFTNFPGRMLPDLDSPGDTFPARLTLVIATYTVAVVVPNVHSLISLAGALAGSSSALLIPPIAELAWIQHLKGGNQSHLDEPTESQNKADGENHTSATSPPSERKLNVMQYTSKPVQKPSAYTLTRIKCYVFLVAGFLFMVVGVYRSLVNIILVYSGQPDAH